MAENRHIGTLLAYASDTHRGNIRDRNEDNLLLEPWPDGSALLAVVADGMGGHSGGEVASQIAVDTFRQLLTHPIPAGQREMYDLLLERFYAADQAIREAAAYDVTLFGMGATVVAAIITAEALLHLYAGDCRLYHFRTGCDTYVTSDHSVIQVLLETGRITPDQVASHPMRSVVTSCLGGGTESQLSVDPKWTEADSPSLAFRELKPDDVLVLSSDGLWADMDCSRLVGLLDEHRADPDLLVSSLANAALEAGGSDNISIIAVRMLDVCRDSDQLRSSLVTGELVCERSDQSELTQTEPECMITEGLLPLPVESQDVARDEVDETVPAMSSGHPLCGQPRREMSFLGKVFGCLARRRQTSEPSEPIGLPDSESEIDP